MNYLPRSQPPRLATALLRMVVPRGAAGRALLGDLDELWRERRDGSGAIRADLWYFGQAFGTSLSLLPTHLRERPLNDERRRTEPILKGAVADLRYAIRTLCKRPGFSIVAALTFALGIGANTAVFSLLHTVLLRPLPFPNSHQLLIIDATDRERGVDQVLVSYAELLDWQQLNRGFSEVSGFKYVDAMITALETPLRTKGTLVSANFLDVLGVEPLLGRGFRPEDESAHVERVVLISEELWHREFGGDPEIIGKSIILWGEPSTIVGVLPVQMRFPEASEIWSPFRWDPESPRFMRETRMIGRLRPEVTRERALTDLQRISSSLASQYPETNRGVGVRVTPVRDFMFGSDGQPIVILYGVASLVLLLACASVAGLFLVRNDTRRHEIAVRSSLGMSRFRLVRMLLSESLVVATLGGILGVALGWFSRDAILALRPPELPPLAFPEIRFDLLVCTATIVLISGVLFGLIPALITSHYDPVGIARKGNRSVSPGSKLRRSIVATTVALALAVLVGANLMVKSAVHHASLDPGFDLENVATVRLHLPDVDWPDRNLRKAFFEEMLASIRGLAPVQEASIISELPSENQSQRWRTHAEGVANLDSRNIPRVLSQVCDIDYFLTMRIPLLAGRDFTSRDRSDHSPRVVIVNEALARHFWPGEDPIGKRIGLGSPSSEDKWYTVVGLVGDTFNRGWGLAAEPEAYYPYGKITPWDSHVVARVADDFSPQALFDDLRATMRAVSPAISLSRFRTMGLVIRETHWQLRFYSWAVFLLSVIPLVLAATGVYGITANVVASRRREIAIRIAVGAHSKAVRRQVFSGGIRVLVVGIMTGLSVSLVGTQFLKTLLFEVSPLDGAAFVAAVCVVTAVVLSATYLPLRKIDHCAPLHLLRED